MCRWMICNQKCDFCNTSHHDSDCRCCDVCSTNCLCAWLGPAKGEALLPIPSFRVRPYIVSFSGFSFDSGLSESIRAVVQDVLQILPAAMSWSASTLCVVFIRQKIHEAFLMGPSPSMQVLMVFERWQHNSTSCLVQRICKIYDIFICCFLFAVLMVPYCSLDLIPTWKRRSSKGWAFYFLGDP